jgi:2-oxoglutarate ferredoxin oxidoreductase subunit beta
MSKKNPEYDFKWCPGCGDFAVKRALEMAMHQWTIKTEEPIENTVIVAGIGCSGNIVHLIDGDQPFGIHGVHGRTLPISLGVKMGNPDLNVIVVAGDGDFLSIGAEHIAPAAKRNTNVCAVIMDNGVYGLTKGQSSPTTVLGQITPTTPYGKIENSINPLDLYLTLGVSYVASGFSSKVKEMAQLIQDGMEHPGFSIVHVQSPCTTYNDNYDSLRGNVKKGISPTAYDIALDHDTSNLEAARNLVNNPGIPLGLIYRNPNSVPLENRVSNSQKKITFKSAEDQISAFTL